MSKIVDVRLVTNSGAKIKKVADSMTLRQFYAANGVNYASCSNTVNSVPIQPTNLDMTLEQLSGGADEIRISSIVKQDCAAKIYIHANTFEVKSAVKLKDWKKVLKYNPDFGVYDEAGDIAFAAMVEADVGLGSLSRNGVMWSNRAGADGLASVTGVIPLETSAEEAKAVVAELVGPFMHVLNTLEGGIEAELEKAKNYEKEIDDSIVVM